jgi:hypothetical protein
VARCPRNGSPDPERQSEFVETGPLVVVTVGTAGTGGIGPRGTGESGTGEGGAVGALPFRAHLTEVTGRVRRPGESPGTEAYWIDDATDQGGDPEVF